MTVFASQDIARIRQAFLLGLARNALPAPDALAADPSRDPMLAVLALAGQQQRFAPPQRAAPDPLPEATRRIHDDPRPIMPEAARRIMFRLKSGYKLETYAVLYPALRRAFRAGFRLHPFDLPRMIDFVKQVPDFLGPAERAYLVLSGGGETIGGKLDEITPENWTEFTRDLRAAFLRDLRARDATAARALLEVAFKREPASLRAHLLETLETGLTIDDLPFLESLATDRAESVRALAAKLLTRVPGTPANDVRLAEAARCFMRNTGVLARIGLGSAVQFKAPDEANSPWHWFEGFSVAEVAAAGGLSVDEVIGAIPSHEYDVRRAFWERAVRDGDDATLMALAASEFPRTDRPISIGGLAASLSAPAPTEFIEAWFAAPAFHATLQRLADQEASRDAEVLFQTAAILPESKWDDFLFLIQSLPPDSTRIARDYIDFFRALAAQPR